jgi:cytidine deaminase
MNDRPKISDAELLSRAEDLLARAYGRYSTVRVAAVVVLDDGTLHDGVNVENSSLGLTICAERNALFGAVTDGAAVAPGVAGPRPVRILFTSNSDDVTVPCGACRQVIRELAPLAEIVFGRNGAILARWTSIDELLPFAFDGGWDSSRPGSAG